MNYVDMSKWGGELTLAEASEMKARGVEVVGVGCGPGGYSQYTRQQIGTALQAGLLVDAYFYLEWGSNPKWWAEQSLASVAPFFNDIRMWWMDLEDVLNPPPPTLQGRFDYVDAAIATMAVRGVRPELENFGLYSGHWYWVRTDQMANTTRYRHFPLWNAWHDTNPDIDGLPFGGWVAGDVWIEQFQGTTIFAGQSVDLNFMYRRPEGSPVPPDSINDRITAMTRLLADVVNGQVPADSTDADGWRLNELSKHSTTYDKGIVSQIVRQSEALTAHVNEEEEAEDRDLLTELHKELGEVLDQ